MNETASVEADTVITLSRDAAIAFYRMWIYAERERKPLKPVVLNLLGYCGIDALETASPAQLERLLGVVRRLGHVQLPSELELQVLAGNYSQAMKDGFR